MSSEYRLSVSHSDTSLAEEHGAVGALLEANYERRETAAAERIAELLGAHGLVQLQPTMVGRRRATDEERSAS